MPSSAIGDEEAKYGAKKKLKNSRKKPTRVPYVLKSFMY